MISAAAPAKAVWCGRVGHANEPVIASFTQEWVANASRQEAWRLFSVRMAITTALLASIAAGRTEVITVNVALQLRHRGAAATTSVSITGQAWLRPIGSGELLIIEWERHSVCRGR